jgi:hypothetical protein
MKNPINNFDYRVGCDDFFLYELGRLIDEDRASLEDDEFPRLIGAGIHEHIERRLEIRAEIAAHLRKLGAIPTHMIRVVEDIEAPLRDVPFIVQSYTAYLFRKLETCADEKPDDKVEAAADLLLESPEDRAAAEMALATLGSTQSAVSARVLAHVISEPILEEDLEMKAYGHIRVIWPLARPYILYLLKPHTHEDIPFRWFQLFVDCDEPSTVDRILEEILVHSQDPNYREDLLALLELLAQTRDPAAEDKILQVLNSDGTSRWAREVLEGFLRNSKPFRHHHSDAPEPWKSLGALYAANEKYLAAAKLFDAGRKIEAGHKLRELLKEHPRYPLALMLNQVLSSDYSS